MTAAEVLADLHCRGVEVTLGTDGRVHLRGAGRPLTAAELARIRQHRADLAALLAAPEVSPTSDSAERHARDAGAGAGEIPQSATCCPHCGGPLRGLWRLEVPTRVVGGWCPACERSTDPAPATVPAAELRGLDAPALLAEARRRGIRLWIDTDADGVRVLCTAGIRLYDDAFEQALADQRHALIELLDTEGAA